MTAGRWPLHLLALLPLSGMPALAAAATWRVPADYSTIATALSVAASGDTVLVAPGTYVEDLELVSGVTLRGNGDPQQVILQGTGASSVLHGTQVGEGTQVVSLTVRGGIGRASGGSRLGGGIYVETSILTLQDVWLRDNQADLGGGLCAENSAIHWTGGALTGNAAVLGGGAFLSKGSHTLSAVAASGNHATSGGVLYAQSAILVTLDDCLWTDNAATDAGGAGFVALTACLASYCRFEANTAGGNGGAFTLRAGSTAEFSHCVFYENAAGGAGGSWHARCDGLPGSACVEVRLSHCDVFRNHSPLAAGGAVDGAAWAEIRESAVAGNDTPAACLDARGELRLECTATAGNGTSGGSGCAIEELDVVIADPGLCDLDAGQLERCANSPLLVTPPCGSGPYGALAAGCGACGPTASEATTWGRLKVRYR